MVCGSGSLGYPQGRERSRLIGAWSHRFYPEIPKLGKGEKENIGVLGIRIGLSQGRRSISDGSVHMNGLQGRGSLHTLEIFERLVRQGFNACNLLLPMLLELTSRRRSQRNSFFILLIVFELHFCRRPVALSCQVLACTDGIGHRALLGMVWIEYFQFRWIPAANCNFGRRKSRSGCFYNEC